MPIRRGPAAVLLLCLTAAGSSSCLARRRVITRTNGTKQQSQGTLLTTNKTTLLETIARQYDRIRDFSATVDMTPALGSAEKSKITEYKDVRGYILFRKPADIRIIGLYPVVRNTAFDMVSNGSTFRLYIPSKDRFLTGANAIDTPSPNKIENLRPQHFLDAMLVQPVAANQKVLLENFTDEEDAYYILHIVLDDGSGQLFLQRTLWVSRLDLRLSRQIILDNDGNILTDARYGNWDVFDGVPFPRHVEINRPRDEYGVVLDVVKLDINKGISDEKFVLEQPEGSKLQSVGQGAPPPPPPQPPSKGRNRKR
jgi:outer membrane lipoprotein-sorting protein